MKFTKLHGCGNDYLYVDLATEVVADAADLARRMSDRHLGAGSDGLILIKTLVPLAGQESAGDAPIFLMRMHNADGSEAEICGNGIRGFAKYVRDRGMTVRDRFVIQTGAGPRAVECIFGNGKVREVKVDMGRPGFGKKDLGMAGEGEAFGVEVEAAGRKFVLDCVSMGNPHCVTVVDSLANYPVGEVGPVIETHPLFPSRINVHFVEPISAGEVRMRTWERGSGETKACGTGACAVAVVGMKKGDLNSGDTKLNSTISSNERIKHRVPGIKVHLPGGDLDIEWAGVDAHVFMTGPAVEVFTGEWP